SFACSGAHRHPHSFPTRRSSDLFVQSGWGKLHALEQVTSFFAELGLPAPGFHAVFVSATELVCGALVFAGLFTRLAALPLLITIDRKSTRLNSSHVKISYAVFCL